MSKSSSSEEPLLVETSLAAGFWLLSSLALSESLLPEVTVAVATVMETATLEPPAFVVMVDVPALVVIVAEEVATARSLVLLVGADLSAVVALWVEGELTLSMVASMRVELCKGMTSKLFYDFCGRYDTVFLDPHFRFNSFHRGNPR